MDNIREKAEALIEKIESDINYYDRAGNIMNSLEYREFKESLIPSKEERVEALQAVLKNYTQSNREYKTISYEIEELRQ